MVRAGLDVARLNFSHGTHDDHRETYGRVRKAEHFAGRSIAVLQDLQGPKIRLGALTGEILLKKGDQVGLSSRDDFEATSPALLPTSYENLTRDVRPGDRVLLADGSLLLRAREVSGEILACEVLVGGVLSSRKGINLPDSRVSASSLTGKDLADLEFGLRLGVDLVALSFVRSAADVHVLRDHMVRLGRVVPIISKIEKPEAVLDLDLIVRASEGLMVARGDLGVEMPPETVPSTQRRAISAARTTRKISIVATQMLMSMTENARPTHAEASDVANAVFDGADAVMLSEETATGSYPVKSVETMAALCSAAEEDPEPFLPVTSEEEDTQDRVNAIARAAVVTAHQMKAKAIVAYTHGGTGPRVIGGLRPRCPILGCASADEELRRLVPLWGVTPVRIAAPSSVEELIRGVEDAAVSKGILHAGDTIVITSKMPFSEKKLTNMLKIHRVGE